MGFHVHLIALSWEKDKFVICKCLIILILTDHFSSFDLCVSDVVVGVVERVHLRLLGGGSRDDVRQPDRGVRFCCFQASDWSVVTFLTISLVETTNSNTSTWTREAAL